MEIVALLLAWAFALTFVAFLDKSKGKSLRPAPVRVPVRRLPNAVIRRINRIR